MKTTFQPFEDFLGDQHAETYTGTDDDMHESFNYWLARLDVEEWLMYSKMWAANSALSLYQILGK